LVEGERVVADKNIENASADELNRQIDKLAEETRKKKNQLAPKFE